MVQLVVVVLYSGSMAAYIIAVFVMQHTSKIFCLLTTALQIDNILPLPFQLYINDMTS